jgi:hypothetical protein
MITQKTILAALKRAVSGLFFSIELRRRIIREVGNIGAIGRQNSRRDQLRGQPGAFRVQAIALGIDPTGFIPQVEVRAGLPGVKDFTAIIELFITAAAATLADRFPVRRSRSWILFVCLHI